MKRLIPVLIVLSLGASLAACATPYGQPGGVVETRIAADRYRVGFEGRGGPAYAHDQALVRAAHLTLRDGRQWFVVEDRYTEVDRGGYNNGGPTISIGGGNTSFGRRSASSIGLGLGFQLGGGGQPQAATSLQIRTGSGPAPEGAYDARDVIATVGPRLGGPVG